MVSGFLSCFELKSALAELRRATGGFEAVLIGYSTVEQKYISRFNIRMSLAQGAHMDVLVQYDSDGVWHNQGRIQGAGTRTFMLPVRPRRCDHFRIRLDGSGEARIYSFAKIFEAGSDVYADI